MMPFYFDSTMLLLIPALIFSMWAQFRVKGTFDRFSRVHSRKGATGAEIARMLLDSFGLSSVTVYPIAGNLTDHYNPKTRSLGLSESVYSSTSIAAIGVAAHEVGHAIQHSQAYAPLAFRNSFVPLAGITSTLAMPLFFLGFFMRGQFLMNLGIILFLAVIVFHIVTLPVEYDASSRAIKNLSSAGILMPDELAGAEKVLNAAAWTYVAAALMAVMQLVRLFMLKSSRNSR